MDKYRDLRNRGNKLAHDAVDKQVDVVVEMCERAGFKYRYISIDNKPCMITADVRMDRLGIHVSKGVVIAASIG